MVRCIEALEKSPFLAVDSERECDRSKSLVLSSLSKMITVEYFRLGLLSFMKPRQVDC